MARDIDHPDFVGFVTDGMQKQALHGLRYFAKCAGIKGEIVCEPMDATPPFRYRFMAVGVSIRGKQRLKDCLRGMVIATRNLAT